MRDGSIRERAWAGVKQCWLHHRNALGSRSGGVDHASARRSFLCGRGSHRALAASTTDRIDSKDDARPRSPSSTWHGCKLRNPATTTGHVDEHEDRSAGALRHPCVRVTDEDLDAIAAQLRDAGLVTIGFDADRTETWTLTPEGAQVACQLAMGDEAAFNAILDAVEGRT